MWRRQPAQKPCSSTSPPATRRRCAPASRRRAGCCRPSTSRRRRARRRPAPPRLGRRALRGRRARRRAGPQGARARAARRPAPALHRRRRRRARRGDLVGGRQGPRAPRWRSRRTRRGLGAVLRRELAAARAAAHRRHGAAACCSPSRRSPTTWPPASSRPSSARACWRRSARRSAGPTARVLAARRGRRRAALRRRAGTRRAPAERAIAFAAASQDAERSRPARACPAASGRFHRPPWVPDLARGEHAARRCGAAARGCCSAVAFPLAPADRCEGVIEFLAPDIARARRRGRGAVRHGRRPARAVPARPTDEPARTRAAAGARSPARVRCSTADGARRVHANALRRARSEVATLRARLRGEDVDWRAHAAADGCEIAPLATGSRHLADSRSACECATGVARAATGPKVEPRAGRDARPRRSSWSSATARGLAAQPRRQEVDLRVRTLRARRPGGRARRDRRPAALAAGVRAGIDVRGDGSRRGLDGRAPARGWSSRAERRDALRRAARARFRARASSRSGAASAACSRQSGTRDSSSAQKRGEWSMHLEVADLVLDDVVERPRAGASSRRQLNDIAPVDEHDAQRVRWPRIVSPV